MEILFYIALFLFFGQSVRCARYENENKMLRDQNVEHKERYDNLIETLRNIKSFNIN